MALQGTLDTFELPDVLRLLASTRKTGRLRLQTDRGDGSVWVDQGLVVGVQSPGTGAGDPSEGIFDLLRAKDGSFDFEPDGAPTAPVPPAEVEPLLAAAEERLAEWRDIERVVPSVYAWVRLANELPAPEVTIDAAAWKTVTAIGSGVTVTDLGRSLDLSEVAVCRLVRDLVHLGLASVTDDAPARPVGGDRPGVEWSPASTERFQPIQFADEPAPARPEPVAPPVVEPAGVTATYSVPENGRADAVEDEPERLAPVTPLHSAVEDELDDDEADEVARQLAKLSPRAAQAVAAAAAAETEAERDAALEMLDETDEQVNRSLLLKFLGSVKG
jgi:hypothetical protein